MKMTSEQVLVLVKDMVIATMEMIEIEQKVSLADVDRAKNIVREASDRLGESLHDLDAAFANPAAGELETAYRGFRQKSVEALQFDDIVSQILDQCTRRGDSMLGTLYRLYDIIESLENDDPYVDLARMRTRYRRETNRHRVAIGEFDSVKQESLAGGDVELF